MIAHKRDNEITCHICNFAASAIMQMTDPAKLKRAKNNLVQHLMVAHGMQVDDARRAAEGMAAL